MVVEVTKSVKDVQSPSHKTLPLLMPIHDNTLKDADDNRTDVEKMTIVERSDFYTTLKISRGKSWKTLSLTAIIFIPGFSSAR